MRLLYVCNDMSLSGSPQAVLTEASALAQRGHNVWVVSRNGPLVDKLISAGVHWVESDVPFVGQAAMPTTRKLTPREFGGVVARYIHRLRLPRLVRLLVNLITRHQIDLIQSHQPGGTQAAHIASLITGVPFVVRIQHSLRNEFPPIAYTRLVERSSAISVITPEVKQNLVRIYGIPEERIGVIPTGVDLGGFAETPALQPDPTVLRLASVSTLGEGKYIPARVLLEAALVAKPARPVKISIVGDGPRRQELTRLADLVNATLGYQAAELVGATPDVQAYLEAADMVIGVGRVAMETLAAGRLLLCASGSASAGVFGPESADHIADFNFSGRHTMARPTAEQFASIIEDISRWPADQIQERATWGQIWVKRRFALENVIAATEDLFLQVLRIS